MLNLREWSFTLDIEGQEIYQRYQSFETPELLKSHVLQNCPTKMDIGAVCNIAVSLQNSAVRSPRSTGMRTGSAATSKKAV